ncbi:MerR family transcriptional regulator [Companilactobacillus futsaii]|uniref:MerR family transcriptional regulator n=1 Tax=Companilactobacillus futsaii TaxID=938155 RepID=UPI0018A105F7|nr:MerR family transcriptional regulator [Companilactobacillus futsaii]
MSEYTTGELAKIAGVSVRTLQYYDKKELLIPSKIQTGGKRIYTAEDLNKLKLILLLKNLGLTLKSIAEIIDSPNSTKVLNLLLDQQEKALKDNLKTTKEQLKLVENIKRDLPMMSQTSLQSIDDIDKIMENKKALRKVHFKMLFIGIIIDIIEIAALLWGIFKGQWMPFVFAIVLVILLAGYLSYFYYDNTNYICPNCNFEFKPKFWEVILKPHNSRARKLRCPNCHQENYCVEIYDEKQTIKTNK